MILALLSILDSSAFSPAVISASTTEVVGTRNQVEGSKVDNEVLSMVWWGRSGNRLMVCSSGFFTVPLSLDSWLMFVSLNLVSMHPR